MKLFFLILICLFLSASIASAQIENSVELQRNEMKKVESLVGQWKGGGWIQHGTKRETFTGTETVQRKLEGLALLVEGKFTNPEGKVIHETLGVVSFDANAKKHRLRASLASGSSGDHDLRLLDDGFEWGFQVPSGTIRYTIKTSNDVWHEIGEFSKDGKTWIKFFEMKLEKVK